MEFKFKPIVAILLATVISTAPGHSAPIKNGCSPGISVLKTERSNHRQRFVTVDDGVKLEVLDWGGEGQPLVLLAGVGNTAHVFDSIAPELARHFHVYGITRRGFGASSIPTTGYTPDRLGDDVVAVLDALGLHRPVLAGHSIAGEELSAIGTRFPDRVAGLIYLDAAKYYSIYDPQRGGYGPDLTRLGVQMARMNDDPLDQQQMTALLADVTILRRSLTQELTAIATDEASAAGAIPAPPGDVEMAHFEAFRCFISKQLGGAIPEDEIRQTFTETATGGVGKQKTPAFVYNAILKGEDRFDAPDVPILAIVPIPKKSGAPIGSDVTKRQAADSMHTHMQEAEIETLQHQRPSAQIVRIPYGYHHIFLSNPSQVVAAITAFGNGLPQPTGARVKR